MLQLYISCIIYMVYKHYVHTLWNYIFINIIRICMTQDSL